MQLDALIVPLLLDSSKFNVGISGAKASSGGLGTSLTGVFSKIGLGGIAAFASVSGAIVGTIAVLKTAYTDTMDYLDVIREMSLLNGTSADETARLIQVGKEHELTQTDLNTASKTLAKEGIPLTVQSLADLSDAYLALKDPAEKQAFLMQNFGARGGTAFVELMQLGGQAIKDEAAAVEAGLVPTQEMLDKQEQLKDILIDINTQWKIAELEMGVELIPTLLELAKALLPIVKLLDDIVKFATMNPILWIKDLLGIPNLAPQYTPSGRPTGAGGGGGINLPPPSNSGHAKGGSFLIPPGYENDSFPLMVQSGERVDVTPAGKSGGGTVINIYNPVPVKADDSLRRAMLSLNYLGSAQ